MLQNSVNVTVPGKGQLKKEENRGQWIDAQKHKEGSNRVLEEWVSLLIVRDQSQCGAGWGESKKEVISRMVASS